MLQFHSRWEVYQDWGNRSSNDLEENRRKSRTYVSNVVNSVVSVNHVKGCVN